VAVNGGGDRSADRRGRRSAARRLPKGLRMPAPNGESALEYPNSLLRFPSAAMFLLMREAFRVSQERVARADTPEEQMRFPHLAVLAALDEFGAASQRDISRRLRIDPSDLVAFVDWLEGVGFVHRTRDERDRRRYRVDLTPAGRRALDVRTHIIERMNEEIFRGLDDHERERLHELLLRAVTAVV
jgi:DNA-binding MarR family transcriptional regulator